MQPVSDSERASRRRLARWIALVFGALLSLLLGMALWQSRGIFGTARNWSDLSDGAAVARELRGPGALLEYIAAHPRDVSLVAYRVGDEASGIYLNADVPRALAGAERVLVACAIDGAIEAGALRPDEPVALAEVETYWLPGTDNGAHERALGELRAGRHELSSVPLEALVSSMLRSGDHAAADYLMGRLGRSAVATLPARLGLHREQAPLPRSGTFLSWENTREQGTSQALLARYRALGDLGYANEVWRLTEALHGDPQLRAAERARLARQAFAITMGEQAALARALAPRGTARGYAQLMARIQAGALPGSERTRDELAGPPALATSREAFTQLGSVGGSLPGILTSTTFGTPRGAARPLVIALFFEAMPIAVWLELTHSTVSQRFEQLLLSDPAFFERVQRRLAGSPGS